MDSGIRLDAVCQITMGQAPQGDSYNTTGIGLPLIAGAGDFGETYPAVKKYTDSPSKLCEPGDIVLGIRASIGDKVIADRAYCLGRGVAGLRPTSRLDSRYLWHWLSHSVARLAAKAKGATFKQVNREDISELRMLLPPLGEQRRIAAILDQADALRAKRRVAIAKLDTLTQAIFLEMFGDPAANPKAWPKTTIGELGEIGTGSTPSRLDDRNFGGGIPWVKTTEVDWEEIRHTEETLTVQGLKSSRCKLYPKGSVVIALYGQGPTRGRAAILGIDATTNQACGVIQPSDRFDPNFLIVHLRCSYGKLREMSRGGSQANLNLTLLSSFTVLSPPIDLQVAFSNRIEFLRKARSPQERSSNKLDALFASLQHRAFRGEL